MTSDLENYRTFITYIARGHTRKARAFEEQHPEVLSGIEKSREGRRCFQEVIGKGTENARGNYLFYCIFKRESK